MDRMAVNKAPLIMPPSTRVISAPPHQLASSTPSSTAAPPRANAPNCTSRQSPPYSMPSAAPAAAPASTPSKPGDTSGLRNTA